MHDSVDPPAIAVDVDATLVLVLDTVPLSSVVPDTGDIIVGNTFCHQHTNSHQDNRSYRPTIQSGLLDVCLAMTVHMPSTLFKHREKWR